MIHEAEMLRQHNSLVHASSELMVDSYKKDICEVIESLSKLISELLKSTDLPIVECRTLMPALVWWAGLSVVESRCPPCVWASNGYPI